MDDNNEPLGGFAFSPAENRRVNRQRAWRRWRRMFSQVTDIQWLWENGYRLPALLWMGLTVAIWATVFYILWCVTPA